jgi:segregation and condensation protein B
VLYENESKKIVEGLLFISNEGMTPMMLADLMQIDREDAQRLLDDLYEDYMAKERGFFIRRMGQLYQFATIPLVSPYIEGLFRPKASQLSKASVEILAIIAYKRKVTRGEIEVIRGVKSEGPLAHLLEKNLIEEAGRLEVSGRPILYQTTDIFLRTFGLASLDDLPNIEEYQSLFDKVSEKISDEDNKRLEEET